jgi:hypothetical protein
MNNKNRNDQRPGQNPSSQNAPKNAGGVDDIEEGEERMEDEGGQQPGGGRPSESERPNSPDSRWGGSRKR